MFLIYKFIVLESLKLSNTVKQQQLTYLRISILQSTLIEISYYKRIVVNVNELFENASFFSSVDKRRNQ